MNSETLGSNYVNDNEFAAIGLRGEVTDTQIHHNKVEDNGSGMLLSNSSVTGTKIHNNCFDNEFGLVSMPGDHVANAENNFWGASDGPSGFGPGGVPLLGSGDPIVQDADDAIDVEPFLIDCKLSKKSKKSDKSKKSKKSKKSEK